MKPQLILLGAPGSGKGTQAAKLVSELGYNHVSTGDLLRTEIAKKTDLGKRIAGIIEQGKLVDDATVLELLQSNCDLQKGAYIFDGYPRNKDQAKALDDVVLKGTKSVAIYLEVDLDLLMARITNRRTCSNKACGEIFNLLTKVPKKQGICDKCGAEIIQRKDDNEETVNNRFGVFKSTIGDILEYYKGKGVLHTIDASINPDVTFAAVRKALGV